MNPLNPRGVKTTEFWVLLLVIGLAVVSAVLGEMDAEWAVGMSAALGAIYAVVRMILKLQGKGAMLAQVDELRGVVRDEMRFALGDKEKADAATLRSEGTSRGKEK